MAHVAAMPRQKGKKLRQRHTPNLIDGPLSSEMPAYELGCRLMSLIAYPELHPKTAKRQFAFLRAAISNYLMASDYLAADDK
jgi:hypothetical protein